jgi:hypothetical protein
MPAIITHYTFALETMKDPSSPFKEAILVGAQGPDPFFFFGQYPFKKRANAKEVDSFGTALHDMDIAPVYSELLKYAHASKDKDLLFAYIEGLFLHYSLDRECHPYIFSKAGYASEPPEKKKHYSASHCRLESYIDILLGKEYGTFTYRTDKLLDLKEEELAKISAMWAVVNSLTLKNPYVDEETFRLALHDYRQVMHFVNTPHRFKRGLIALLVGKDSQPYCMNFPSHFTESEAKLDFFNEAHAPWPAPATGEMRTDSFFDDWSKAEQDYQKVLPLLEKAKDGKDILKELTGFVGDIDHDGIHPSEKITHTQVIWNEKERQ